MSNEINAATAPGQTLYALIFNKSGQVWDAANEEFTTYATASRGDYDIPLTEQGTSSGIYLADFPSAITAGGTYSYYAYIQGGASPAEPTTDTLAATGGVDWTGTASTSAAANSQSASDWLAYVKRGGFIRTDKDTEIYEATTDAIQELRRRMKFDEAHADTTTTDTISTLGDYQIDLESDFGLLVDIMIQDGEDANKLHIVSKSEFDSLYPDHAVTSDKGYPKHASLYNGKIYIGPIPDQTSYTYRIGYSERGGTVDSSTSSVPFTALYRDILRELTYVYLYEMLDAFDKAQYYRQKFETKYVEMEGREIRNQKLEQFSVYPRNC